MCTYIHTFISDGHCHRWAEPRSPLAHYGWSISVYVHIDSATNATEGRD